LLGDEARADAVIGAATGDGVFDAVVDASVQQMLAYAEMLTKAPESVDQSAVAALRAAGLDDGEILEVNQVVAYFAYANRTVLGLGVNAEGDDIGLSPNSDDPDAWGHQ